MLYIFSGASPSRQLKSMMDGFCLSYANIDYVRADHLPKLQPNDSVLLAIDMDEITGTDCELLHLIRKAGEFSKDYFYGAKGAILISNETSMLHTKTFASKIAFLTNRMGLAFVGKPLVEALLGYRNFINKQKQTPLALEELCFIDCQNLGQRLFEMSIPFYTSNITAIHTSRPEVSNTYALMNKVLDSLDCDKQIFSLSGQHIMDCRGCPHNLCMTLSSKGRCYYHGDILEKVFQSLLHSDTMMIACPNYNDSMPANYFAMVNRMTYIYRAQNLTAKKIYAVIVSSNSGSDMVASQVISAFCFNKGFQLPPYFALMEQAYDPLSILNDKKVEEEIAFYVDGIKLNFKHQ